jgi:kynurenine formamidase
MSFSEQSWVAKLAEGVSEPSIDQDEIGALRALGPAQVLTAMKSVRSGNVYDLDAGRFPGMPIWPGHPPYQVVTFLTPRGIARQPGWTPDVNWVNQGAMTEMVIATQHSGTHIDALAHHTVGPDSHWYGGFSTESCLGDSGPTKADISTTPPIFARGILLDIPGLRQVDRLRTGELVTIGDVVAALDRQRVELRENDAILFRTGLMSVWPDVQAVKTTDGAGPDLATIRWLVEEQGACFVASDTSVLEQQPSPIPGVPQPVHAYLLIERGVHIGEYFYLENLARDQVYEFLLIVLPLRLSGGTGSMVRPIAVV